MTKSIEGRELTEREDWLDLGAGLGLMMARRHPELSERIEEAMRNLETTGSLMRSGGRLEHVTALAIGHLAARRNPHAFEIAKRWEALSIKYHSDHCTDCKAREGTAMSQRRECTMRGGPADGEVFALEDHVDVHYAPVPQPLGLCPLEERVAFHVYRRSSERQQDFEHTGKEDRPVMSEEQQASITEADKENDVWTLIIGDQAGSTWSLLTTEEAGRQFLAEVIEAREAGDDSALADVCTTVVIEGWCNVADRAPRTVQLRADAVVAVDFFKM